VTDALPSPFSHSSLQQAVERAIADSVPEGKHGALVAVMTTDGIRVAVAARINDVWQVKGLLEKQHEGPLTGAAAVTATW
jgi:hypothetical protein